MSFETRLCSMFRSAPSRRERQLRIGRVGVDLRVSIRALAKRATGNRFRLINGVGSVSIRALAKRATARSGAPVSVAEVSIRALAKRATWDDQPSPPGS